MITFIDCGLCLVLCVVLILRSNLEKCRLLQSEVKFLGHIVSCQGIATDPSKVKLQGSGLYQPLSKRSNRFLALQAIIGGLFGTLRKYHHV